MTARGDNLLLGAPSLGDVLTRAKRQRALYGNEQLTLFNESQMDELKTKEVQLQHLSQESDSTSSPHSSGSQIRLRNELSRFTWVQCDNPDCMKWRKILNSDADKLDAETKWFCLMNPDGAYNRCEIKEEDYTAYEKMAAKCKMKYVLSALPVGELVWAKIAGYCSWPAMITKDPALDDFVSFGLVGNPEWYHVEFLGQEHSHSWTRAASVAPYGHKDPQELTLKTSKGQPKLTVTSTKGCKRRYKKTRVEDAVNEAELMLKLGMDERMERCMYKKLPPELSTASVIETPKSDVYQFHDEPTRLPKKNVPKKLGQESEVCKVKKEKKHNLPKSSRKAKKQEDRNKHTNRPNHGLKPLRDNYTGEATPSGDVRMPPVVPSFGNGVGPLTSFSATSMAVMSKEEKLTLDIENYRRKEKAFNHDLTRFLQRHDRKVSRLPFWQNMVVNLFSLFQSVVDRGGFQQVCHEGRWNSVYREVASTNNGGGGGVCAKKYYERNLLAYEKFLAKKDYEEYLPKKPGRRPQPRKEGNEEKSRPRKEEKENKPSQDGMTMSIDDQELEFEHDIINLEEILNTLDDISDREDGDENVLPPKIILPLCFGDDSPPLKARNDVLAADVASEFGFTHQLEECAQTVPVCDFVASDSGSVDEALLHEMQAMEQVFDQMDNAVLDWM